MIYSPEEKKRIENLIAAFSEYIRNNEITDVIYSEKFGFIVVSNERQNGDGTFVVAQSYDHLLNWLCSEVAFDFIVEKTLQEEEPDYEEVFAKSCAYLEPILNTLGEDKERCFNKIEEFLKDK